MTIEIYAIQLLAFYTYGIIDAVSKKRYLAVVEVGINVLLWSPILGRAMGWW